MRKPDSKTIVIIGGGVIGLSTAYYAAHKGHRVRIIDRHPPEHPGCSYGNAGMVVPSHFVPLAAPGMVARGLKWMWNPKSPFYIKPRLNLDLARWGFGFWRASTTEHVRRCAPVLRDLHFESRSCFEELSSLADPGFDLQRRGLLMLCKSERTLEEEAHAASEAIELGVPARVLTAAETAQTDPGVRMNIAGSVYYPKDCHLTPHRFMQTLLHLLKRSAVTFEWNTEVLGWRKQGRRIEAVETSRGDFVADEYVVCGGSWSPTVAAKLGIVLPMQAGKGYSLTLPHPRQQPSLCAILTEARLAVTPMGHALRIGGTMEIAGLDESINPIRIRGILESIPGYYPEFVESDFRGIAPWSGLRPCSPDGMPYIGRFARFNNLSTATGHAMMGLSLAPATGKLMARILSDEPIPTDLSLLDPNRYA